MVTQDDKLLGEKVHYYCSSSEDEDEGSGAKPTFIPEEETRGQGGVSANTGPKGVIEDWRRFKQLERENKEEQELEKLELAKKLSMTCRTDAEDAEAKAKEEKLDEELEALLDDEVLAEFMQKRMKEMMEQTSSAVKKRFGQLLDLKDADNFLNAVDKEDKSVVVIVFIYEEGVTGCEAMTGCINLLAKDHPSVKFCRIRASTAGLSKHFKSDGVPALLVYRGGELVSSFVRVTDALGDDFYVSDLESFLVEHAILSDKELVPTLIRSSEPADDDSD